MNNLLQNAQEVSLHFVRLLGPTVCKYVFFHSKCCICIILSIKGSELGTWVPSKPGSKIINIHRSGPCRCCLPCNNCNKCTWNIEEIILTYGNGLRFTHSREFPIFETMQTRFTLLELLLKEQRIKSNAFIKSNCCDSLKQKKGERKWEI